jgi:hypothetical protein
MAIQDHPQVVEQDHASQDMELAVEVAVHLLIVLSTDWEELTLEVFCLPQAEHVYIQHLLVYFLALP